MSRARNPPLARGENRSSRLSDAPKPGRSTAKRRACSASVVQIGANAYTLSGHGLVSRIVGSRGWPLSAYRIVNPSNVPNCSLIGFSTVFRLWSAHPPPARSQQTLAPAAMSGQMAERRGGRAEPSSASRECLRTRSQFVLGESPDHDSELPHLEVLALAYHDGVNVGPPIGRRANVSAARALRGLKTLAHPTTRGACHLRYRPPRKAQLET
jgi:hypothetical protein